MNQTYRFRIGGYALALLLILLFGADSFAQVSGTKTIPGDYATIEAAISAINSGGIGSGGVTFNVAAGHTETFTSPTAGRITATGTSGDPIVFQKSGGGANPLITAALNGTTTTLDGIIVLQGTDYITFDGISLQENGSNSTTTTQMEFGYALLKKNATAPFDGCQYVTIKNCTVTLNKTNTATFAVYAHNHVATSTTTLTITATTDANSNNTIDNVTSANSFSGILFNGFLASAPYTLYDQNNTVKNCTIQNFGGASTSYGVRSIYQNNFVVNSNNIDNMANGGSASTSTIYGIMNSTGTEASFIARYNTVSLNRGSSTSGMYGISSASTGNAWICQNTLTNFVAGGSSGLVYFIQQAGSITSSYAAYMDSNYIGNSTSLNTTGTIGALYASTSTPTYFIRNNTINNITRTGTSGSFYGHYNASGGAGTVTIAYNTVKNITQSGTAAFYGVFGNSSSSQNWTVRKDSVYNITNGSGSSYGLYVAYGATVIIDSNYVSDIAGTGTVYGIATSSSVTTGNVYLNKVKTLSSSGTSSAVYGINNTVSSSGTMDCYRNQIYDLSSSGTSGLIYGIGTGGGLNLRIYNNYVSDLRAPSSSSTTALEGLYFTGGTNVFSYYNSVFLNGSSSSSTFGSSALYAGSTTTLDLRNNVLVNVSTPGNGSATAKTSAFRRSGLTTQGTYYASASNANCLYAGTPDSARVLYFDASMYPAAQTISAYKAIVSPKDANSFTENPPFINVATTPYNLHMGTGTPTQTESGGVVVSSPIAVTNDFDGESRSGSTPDVGADEFVGTGLDLSAPAIAYTALGNTASLTNRSLAATITDASSVPTAGIGLPVLYWRINTGSWNSATATHGGGSTYNFSFGSGVIAGDSVQYYVVAQDQAGTPNIGAYPSTGAGGFTTNPPAAGTPPTSPSQYKIVGAISGSFTVGSGGNYASIGAAITDISNKEVTGAVTLNLIDATYDGETFPITVPQFSGVSASNTVTLKPAASNTVTIRCSTTTAAFKLNGADYFIIDGSNSGGTSKDMTIINYHTSGSVIWIASLGANAGATYNTIKNCVVQGASVTVTTANGIVAASSASLTTAGEDNDYLTIQNNLFRKCYVAVNVFGTSSNMAKNFTFQQNTVGVDTGLDTLVIGKAGLILSQVNNATITQNTFQNFESGTVVTTPVACSLAVGVTNATVTRNKIYNIRYTGTGGYGGRALYVGNSSATNNITIANNVIYQIQGDGYSGFSASSPVGIYLDGSGLTGINLYYNSVNMFGSLTYSTTSGTITTAMLLATSGMTSIDIRNNSFANSMANTNTGNPNKNYAIYSASANTAFTSINYNDYYVSGTQGVLGFLGTDKTTLGDWQTATAQDANSLNADPQYNSNTNLIPQGTSPLLAAGTPVSVTTDYLGTTRSVTTPTIGAYEGAVDISGPTITFTDLGNTTSTSNRSFTNVTITDPSGVNGTSGTRPRVYYKRSTDANAWNDNTSGTDGWKWAEANGASSPFDFTIDYSKLNGGTGVTGGNTVQYFVVAQDNQLPPYVSIQSGAFAATPASVALTGAAFPVTGTIKSYAISTALTGTVTVGTGGTYASLTGAGGFFSVLNSGVVTGNVTVNILSDLTEDGTNTANLFSEEPVNSNFTVTIQPSAATNRTISGTYAGGLIRLNGAKRITFDGRYSGAGKYLTFTNTATTGTVAAFQLYNSAKQNTIRYCNISTGFNTASSYGIAIGGTTVGTTGADNDSNTVANNVITKAYYGIYAQGSATSNPGIMDYLQVTGNTVGSDVSGSSIGLIGMVFGNATALDVSQNTVNYVLNGSTTCYAISCTTGVVSSTISRNNINNIRYTGTGGYGGRGLYINTGNASSSITVSNNLIHTIQGDGYTSFSNSSPVGIYLDGTTGGITLYYNSVNMYGTLTRNAATLTSAMLLYSSTITAVDMRNNVFVNTMNNTANTGAKNYAIYSASANTAFTNINYNDYYVSGTQGILGYLGGDQATLGSWKTATAQDANSIDTDPQFNSSTDLKPLLGAPVLAAGTPVSVTIDYSGVTRNVSTPSIGAYENGGDGAPPVITYTALLSTTSTSNRTLSSVTITDALSGLNTTAGTKPRIYFKKSTDANAFGGNTSTDNGWKWTETGDAASPFSFTINYAIINGGSIATDDIVQYFVVAQDLNTPSPNVGSNPSAGFVAASVSSISSAPTTPNQYKVVGPPLSGDYTVGLLAFNKASGRNVTPVTVTRTVTAMRPVVQSAQADKGEARAFGETGSQNYRTRSVVVGFEPVQTEETVTLLSERGQILSTAPYIDYAMKANGAASAVVSDEDMDNVKGVYSTISAAVAAVNERGVSGPVRLLLNDATYPSETFPITFDFSTAGAQPTATNTVTLKPNTGVDATISGNVATSVIKLNGADYVVIDGSNVASGTSRNLTIENTITTSGTSAVIWLSSPSSSDGASNNVIKNCVIQGTAMTSSTVLKGIGTGGATSPDAVALAQNNNNTFTNNKISKALYGIDILGTSGTVMDSNVTVTNNEFGSGTSGDGFYYGGIYLESTKNALVSGNTVRNITQSAGTTDMYGIWTATTKEVSVLKNNIFDIGYTGTSTYKNFGLRVSNGTYTNSANPSQNLYANNTITTLTSTGTSSYYNCMGVLTTGGYGNKYYYNTIYLTGNIAGASGGGLGSGSACFANASTLTTSPVDSAMDIRNNIFVNMGTSTGSTMYAFALLTTQTAPGYAANTVNYNNLYTSVSSPLSQYVGYLGSTSYAALSAWKTASLQDAMSKSAAVTFAGATDLHLAGGSIGDKNLQGTPVSVTTDMDGNTRNAYAPYMGADEIPGTPLALGLNLTAYIEGFYSPSLEAMVADTMKVYLRSGTNYAKIDSATAVLNTSGAGTFVFTGNSKVDSSYYLVLSHRNSIETWSAAAQTFPSGERTYNFTTAASQAYGSNMVQEGSAYCIYSGDVTLDGIVDFSDLVLIDNDQFNFVGGYVSTDITGDDFVDFSDLALCDNNQFNFISVISPLVAKRPVVVRQLDAKPVLQKQVSKPVSDN